VGHLLLASSLRRLLLPLPALVGTDRQLSTRQSRVTLRRLDRSPHGHRATSIRYLAHEATRILALATARIITTHAPRGIPSVDARPRPVDRSLSRLVA